MLASRPGPQRTGKYLKLNSDFVFDHCAVARSKSQCLRELVELIHLDIKKLGRIGSVGHRITGRYPGAVNRHHGIGWEFVHVCIDDASRVAFVKVMANQRKESTVAFLQGCRRLLR
jgi:hypothetical protein